MILLVGPTSHQSDLQGTNLPCAAAHQATTTTWWWFSEQPSGQQPSTLVPSNPPPGRDHVLTHGLTLEPLGPT